MEVVNRIVAHEEDGVVRSLTADKGYFALEEIAQIQEFDMRTVIGSPAAIIAVAHRVARIRFAMLRDISTLNSWALSTKNISAAVKTPCANAASLGFELVPIQNLANSVS